MSTNPIYTANELRRKAGIERGIGLEASAAVMDAAADYIIAAEDEKAAARAASVKPLRSADDLRAFATIHKLRADWHEPDEQGISARIIGTHLDNAMGSTMRPIGENNERGEFNIVLTKDGEDVAVVNLANLLAWASEAE